jgi:hypothetical protein
MTLVETWRKPCPVWLFVAILCVGQRLRDDLVQFQGVPPSSTLFWAIGVYGKVLVPLGPKSGT